ncbi:MAG: GIY-YIG nuclease family protein [Parcubacteria group bacterium]|nr:GIY-YIG nuclease family protein [Parcubacteria group bacterium]
MEYFVYAIRSTQRNYIYVGLTNNIERRIKQHNDGKEKTTRAYSPFRVIYVDKFEDRKSAREKEKYLKSGTGKEFLKKL